MKALFLSLLALTTCFSVWAETIVQTPLEKSYHQAALKGDLDTLRKCIREGVGVNCQDASGNTVLMHATVHRKDKILDFLLLICADLNCQTNQGTTALMMAARTNNVTALAKLIEAGADTTLLNDKHKSASDMAVDIKKNDIADYINAAEKLAQ